MTDPSGGYSTPTIASLPLTSNLVLDDNVTSVTKLASAVAGESLAQILVDNTANSSDVWLKLYDAVVADVTAGTTVPVIVVRALAGDTTLVANPKGWAFSTAISYRVTDRGGTPGTSSPANPVSVSLERITFA
jgi:hypothetical protein